MRSSVERMESKTTEEQIAALRVLIEEQKQELAELNARLKAATDLAKKGARKGPKDDDV